MKKYIRFWALSISASLVVSAGLLAQEKVDVSIKVKKDGKVIQDTTYQFDDASEAKHAIMMMEVLSGDDKAMEHAHGKKVIVMKSDDGNTFDIVVDEDGEESDMLETKEIKVIVSGDEEGNWTVVEGGEKMMEKDENVYIFKGDDDVKVKVLQVVEEDSDLGEDVEVEVKVIKKEKKK